MPLARSSATEIFVRNPILESNQPAFGPLRRGTSAAKAARFCGFYVVAEATTHKTVSAANPTVLVSYIITVGAVAAGSSFAG